MNPGLYKRVPFYEYQSWPAVNPSLAKHGRESMLRYKYAEDHPSVPPPSDAMVLGSATHTAMLEPDEFPLRYVLWGGGRRQGKAWDKCVAAAGEKTVLRKEDYALCLGMRDAVHAHPAAKRILSERGDIELSMAWNDPSSGLACKGRVDHLASRISCLKTIRGLSERVVMGNVSAYGYHISMAAYQDGHYRITGETKDAVLIFVCSSPPHDVYVRPLPDDVVARGLEIWHELLGKIADCRMTGVWPGVSSDEVPLVLPPWEVDSDEPLDLTIDGQPLEV